MCKSKKRRKTSKEQLANLGEVTYTDKIMRLVLVGLYKTESLYEK